MWSDPFGILLFEPLKLHLGTTLLMLSALSTAFGMIGLMNTIGYNPHRIFLAFTSLGVAMPIILSLSLSDIFIPLLPLSIATLTLLMGFLSWCYISLSYFLLWKLGLIIGVKKTPSVLLASMISLIAGFGFLYSTAGSIFLIYLHILSKG
jgi:hypothetical protein